MPAHSRPLVPSTSSSTPAPTPARSGTTTDAPPPRPSTNPCPSGEAMSTAATGSAADFSPTTTRTGPERRAAGWWDSKSLCSGMGPSTGGAPRSGRPASTRNWPIPSSSANTWISSGRPPSLTTTGLQPASDSPWQRNCSGSQRTGTPRFKNRSEPVPRRRLSKSTTSASWSAGKLGSCRPTADSKPLRLSSPCSTAKTSMPNRSSPRATSFPTSSPPDHGPQKTGSTPTCRRR